MSAFAQKKYFDGFEGFYGDTDYMRIIVESLQGFIANDSHNCPNNKIWICLDGMPDLFPYDLFVNAEFFRMTKEWEKKFKKTRYVYKINAELVGEMVAVIVKSCDIKYNKINGWETNIVNQQVNYYCYSTEKDAWILSSKHINYSNTQSLNSLILESLLDYIGFTNETSIKLGTYNGDHCWILQYGLPDCFPIEAIENASLFMTTPSFKKEFKKGHRGCMVSVDLIRDELKIIVSECIIKYKGGLFKRNGWCIGVSSLGKYYYKFSPGYGKWMLYAKQYPHTGKVIIDIWK